MEEEHRSVKEGIILTYSDVGEVQIVSAGRQFPLEEIVSVCEVAAAKVRHMLIMEDIMEKNRLVKPVYGQM